MRPSEANLNHCKRPAYGLAAGTGYLLAYFEPDDFRCTFLLSIQPLFLVRSFKRRRMQTVINTSIGSERMLVTGPPNGPVLFCTLSSVSVVCRRL